MVICAFGNRGGGQYVRKHVTFPRQDPDKGDTNQSLILCHQPEHLNISPETSTHDTQEQFTEAHLDPSPRDSNRSGCNGSCYW